MFKFFKPRNSVYVAVTAVLIGAGSAYWAFQREGPSQPGIRHHVVNSPPTAAPIIGEPKKSDQVLVQGETLAVDGFSPDDVGETTIKMYDEDGNEVTSPIDINNISSAEGRKTQQYKQAFPVFEDLFVQVDDIALELESLRGDCKSMTNTLTSRVALLEQSIHSELESIKTKPDDELSDEDIVENLNVIAAIQEDFSRSLSKNTGKFVQLFKGCFNDDGTNPHYAEETLEG